MTAMEKVTVGDEDRPNEPISITGATVFVNPFKDEEEEERMAAQKVNNCPEWDFHTSPCSAYGSVHPAFACTAG